MFCNFKRRDRDWAFRPLQPKLAKIKDTVQLFGYRAQGFFLLTAIFFETVRMATRTNGKTQPF